MQAHVCVHKFLIISHTRKLFFRCGLHTGLKEGSIVTCTIIADVAAVNAITVTANSQKDWEMLVIYLNR